MPPKNKVNNDLDINIAEFFEKGFEAKEFKNVGDLPLPVVLKFMEHDVFSGKYGDTYRYVFHDKDGEEYRLLCKGETFKKAIEKYVKVGNKLKLNKNEKGYWIFELV